MAAILGRAWALVLEYTREGSMLYALAFVTFGLVAAFLWWNYKSTKEHQRTGGNTDGIGGPNDPMAGSNYKIRDPDVLRASLDAANARREGRTPVIRAESAPVSGGQF